MYRVTQRFFDTYHAWLKPGDILPAGAYNRALAERRPDHIELIDQDPAPEEKAVTAAPKNKARRTRKTKASK